MASPKQKQLEKFVAKRFRLLTIVLVALIAALAYFFVLGPKIEEVQTVGTLDLRRSQEQQQIYEDVLASTESLVNKYEDIVAQDITILRRVLPSSTEIPEMFTQIESLVQESGLILDTLGFTLTGDNVTAVAETTDQLTASLNQQTSTSTAGIQTMSLNLSVGGANGYADLKNLLTNLESHIRLLDVQSLTYTPAAAGEEENYQISAVTYFFAD